MVDWATYQRITYRRELSPLEFGARSGLSDRQALQAAIGSLGALGGQVGIPPGLYLLDAPLQIERSLELQSAPIRLDSWADTIGACLQNPTGSALRVRPPAGSATGVGLWVQGLHLRGAVNPTVDVANFNKVHFKDCTFTSINNIGVQLSKVAYASFENCRFDGPDYGIASVHGIGEYCNAIRIRDCEFACAIAGAMIDGAGIAFDGCTFEGSQDGIRVGANPAGGLTAQGITIHGCYFEGCTVQAMDLGSVAGTRGVSVRGAFMNMNLGLPSRYIFVGGIGVAIEACSFYGIVGDPVTTQIACVNSERVRVSRNSGLDIARVTQVGCVDMDIEV